MWCKDTDWLTLYSDRLAAVHFHDNNGNEDEHSFPLTGTIDWLGTINKIKLSSYKGCITLETEYKGNEDLESLKKFLDTSYHSGYNIALMLEN